MARNDTAIRRYAEAAFEVALRDDTVETWRSELDAAASIASDDRVTRMLANPAVPLGRATTWPTSCSARPSRRPCSTSSS